MEKDGESHLTSRENVSLLSRGSRRNTLLAAGAALLYVVVVGMVTAYSSPACADMKKKGSRFVDITSDQIAWIASLPPLSGVVGNAVAGYVCQKLGRKAVLMYVSTSYTVSWLVIAYASDLSFVYTGRIISGFCAGICFVAVPAYVVEISTVDIRGFLTTGFQLAFALGVFLVTGLGIFLRWSWLAVSGAIFVVSGACLMCLMPESPQWLVRMSRNQEALKGLIFLRSKHSEALDEMREMIGHQVNEEPDRGFNLKDLSNPQLYKPVIIAVTLMFFQQFVGINALMSYAVELLQNSESFMDPTLAATLVTLVQVLGTFVSSLLVDKAGRRVLYMTSGIGMALSLTASGVYSYYFSDAPGHSNWNWMPLFTFITYMMAFSLGFGPIPFVVTPEIVPTHSRSFLLALASLSGSFFSFVVTKTFDNLRGRVGLAGVYWTYAVFAFLGVLFYWFFIPETKGRTIRDIHRAFSRDIHRSERNNPVEVQN